jgi:hypothetical protein
MLLVSYLGERLLCGKIALILPKSGSLDDWCFQGMRTAPPVAPKSFAAQGVIVVLPAAHAAHCNLLCGWLRRITGCESVNAFNFALG